MAKHLEGPPVPPHPALGSCFPAAGIAALRLQKGKETVATYHLSKIQTPLVLNSSQTQKGNHQSEDKKNMRRAKGPVSHLQGEERKVTMFATVFLSK